MILVNKLQVGDIVGTTSGAPIAMAIKFRIYGWRHVLHQDDSSHIATVVDRGQGLLYLAEMLPGGIELTEIHCYDHKKPLRHIVFVKRHPAFNDSVIKLCYNDFMLEAHSRKVKYGFEDMANFLPGIHFKDNPNTWICSELPREGFKECRIPYPVQWEKACSPRHWQDWTIPTDITKTVII